MQNALARLDEYCRSAISQIGVQQQNRPGALNSLVELAKSYSSHEHDTLIETITQRKQLGVLLSPQKIEHQESMLAGSIRHFVALAASYSYLKANATPLETRPSSRESKNRVCEGRMACNNSVGSNNSLVQSTPSSLVAFLPPFNLRDAKDRPEQDGNTRQGKLTEF